MSNRAFRVDCGPDDPPVLVFAVSPQHAKGVCLASMTDAWDWTWQQAVQAIRSVRRAPELDRYMTPRLLGRPLTESYIVEDSES